MGYYSEDVNNIFYHSSKIQKFCSTHKINISVKTDGHDVTWYQFRKENAKDFYDICLNEESLYSEFYEDLILNRLKEIFKIRR